jgi:glutathione S-transferase
MANTLYYSPAACSLAAHVVLEEIGKPFDLVRIVLGENRQHQPDYLAINPRARVPALVVDGQVLTECPAILFYLARSNPEAGLWPDDPWTEGQALSWMSFLASSVHIAFAQILRPARYAEDASAQPAVQETGRAAAMRHLVDINARLTGSQWTLGERYTVVDPYLLFFYMMGDRVGLAMDDVPAYGRLVKRVMERPATRRAFTAEGLLIPA